MRKKVSLVLGSGGARGVTQLGVIKWLTDNGFEINEVVGCSIGSLVGAAFVEGKNIELEEWMAKLTKREVFRLMDFSDPRYGFLKGQRVLSTMQEVFEDLPIENMKLKYTAVASDLTSEEDVVFRTGSVYNAIRASIAIPGVFKSVVTSEGRFLVDGGVLNPLPINYVQYRENIIIAVNLDGNRELLTPITYDKLNAISILQESYLAMRRRLTQLSIELYKPSYVINIPHNISGIWDFDRSKFLIDKGYEFAEKTLGHLVQK
ncbi:patatin-like phospholipase family protein [Sphingobacterium bovistauri]|uniref:Patatin-like phospholipase family protein n=1 Tax=Sphingobacterium bovistauri TaxID=2781959 RepID=A0ABS7Z0N9_9SPHI|nr:patatin-like phospholipase family protein [Sphingobacterium bovistauri]MCA5003691.1 patatin-like phospholipase family protein [Sphingobacterium bovistauri]